MVKYYIMEIKKLKDLECLFHKEMACLRSVSFSFSIAVTNAQTKAMHHRGRVDLNSGRGPSMTGKSRQ